LDSLLAGKNYYEAYTAVADHDFAAACSELEMPVLVMAGGRDSLAGKVAGTVAKIKDCESVDLGAAVGTFACDTHAEAVVEAVTKFVTRCHGLRSK
jgi:NAD(P)H-hydrate repair Nnr-like enzyme with NAD(P)H-hydrate dehydratase domain